MAVPKHHIGMQGDECQCGRRASLRHCIRCGSSRVYCRMLQKHLMMDGTAKLVEDQYRCQTCGKLFIEEEREWCEAPPVGQALALQRMKAIHEAKKTGEYLRPADEKIAKVIEELAPPAKDTSAAESFGLLKFRKKQEYLLLKEGGQLQPPDQSIEDFLIQWQEQEGFTIPEGETLC